MREAGSGRCMGCCSHMGRGMGPCARAPRSPYLLGRQRIALVRQEELEAGALGLPQPPLVGDEPLLEQALLIWQIDPNMASRS